MEWLHSKKVLLNMNIYEPINTNYLNRSHVIFLISNKNKLLDMLKQGKPLTCSFSTSYPFI